MTFSKSKTDSGLVMFVFSNILINLGIVSGLFCKADIIANSGEGTDGIISGGIFEKLFPRPSINEWKIPLARVLTRGSISDNAKNDHATIVGISISGIIKLKVLYDITAFF